MIPVASDKTISLLIWFILLGTLNFLSTEKLPVFSEVTFEKVDLNRAELQDLMRIPRLPFKTAQSILQERNKRGRFRAIEELDSVSGVGSKTLEKLRMFLKI